MSRSLPLRQPISPHQPATPPFWNPYALPEGSSRFIVDESRFQFADTRQQVEMLHSAIVSLTRRIEESEARTSRQIIELEASIRHLTSQAGRNRWDPYQQGRVHHTSFSPPATPIRLPHFVPPSPAPTIQSELSSNSSCELEQNPELPNWLNQPLVQHPYCDYLNLSTSQMPRSTGEGFDTSQDTLKKLPVNHNPEALVYSPFGPFGDNHLNGEQQAKLSERLSSQTDDETMGLVGAEYDDHPIVLGGLNEPLIEGRFPDEPDPHAAFIYRARRWSLHNSICLYRLPRRELLLPSDSSLSDSILARRHTWCVTYRVWYRFVQAVGPSRFPGLVDDSWITILNAPPEETRALFAEVLGSYVGYRGTEGENSTLPHRLPTIIPDLLASFDKAVKEPWPVRLSLGDLILDLDDFAAQREFEAKDCARLWRGILWNNFPKHCTKHLRMSSYGGSDGRWTIVYAEFRIRLACRCKLWQEISHYRFPNNSYLPQATDSRVCDRDQKFKQLLNETYAFSKLLVSWRDGTIHIKYAVLPFLDKLIKADAPLNDTQLRQWLDLVQIIQRFYDSKRVGRPLALRPHQVQEASEATRMEA